VVSCGKSFYRYASPAETGSETRCVLAAALATEVLPTANRLTSRLGINGEGGGWLSLGLLMCSFGGRAFDPPLRHSFVRPPAEPFGRGFGRVLPQRLRHVPRRPHGHEQWHLSFRLKLLLTRLLGYKRRERSLSGNDPCEEEANPRRREIQCCPARFVRSSM
jgi:hypothetical protein